MPHPSTWRFWLAALVALATGCACAADVKVLSAGAVEPGLVPLAQAFERESGHRVHINFATAPVLRQRLAAREVADILIAPPAVVDEAVAANVVVAGAPLQLGRVGVGVVVRSDAPLPDVSSTESLKAALLAADGLVYNRASTGLYFEKLVERLGLTASLAGKTTRYPDGAAVLDRLARGQGREFGVAATTEIIAHVPKGVKLVGPLPAEVQNYTSYAAALMRDSPSPEAARAFVAYLGTAAGKARLAAAGIE